MITKKQLRPLFEKVIAGVPYELSIDRLNRPNQPHHGEYAEYNAQLAWDVLCDVMKELAESGVQL